MCTCETRRRFEHCNTCGIYECEDRCGDWCTCNAYDDGVEPELWCVFPGCTLRPAHDGPHIKDSK